MEQYRRLINVSRETIYITEIHKMPEKKVKFVECVTMTIPVTELEYIRSALRDRVSQLQKWREAYELQMDENGVLVMTKEINRAIELIAGFNVILDGGQIVGKWSNI